MLLNMIFYIRGGRMSKEELEHEWEQELKQLIDYHNEKIKNMTQEEEWKYLKENKVDEEIIKLKNKYCEKYKALENK